MRGKKGVGMEEEAMPREAVDRQRQGLPLRIRSHHLEGRGEGEDDTQRIVARSGEGGGKPPEKPFASVPAIDRLAVEGASLAQLGAEVDRDHLAAEADAHHRSGLPRLQEVEAPRPILWTARPGAKNKSVEGIGLA